MEKDIRGQSIQALPMHSGVYVGIATTEACAGKIVHVNAECDVTFHFTAGDVVLTDVRAGMDFAVSIDCTGVTSTDSILIS